MLSTFRSLSIRNYRIWFIGALISNVGGWMQATTQNWVVLTELTDNNASAVGITMALQFGPQLLLVPFSGAVADRFDRRKVLFVTQSLLGLLALGLGLLLLLGQAEIWHLYAFALGLGIVNAFDSTSRQAFVSDLVGTRELSNAVALNSASFNSARLIGPAVAGVLIALIGSAWVFIINAASFLAMLLALALITTKFKRRVVNSRESQLKQLSAGFRYVTKRHDLLVIFIMVFIVGALCMNFPVMSSTMAVEFGRGASDYGLLSSILAIGSLTGALLAANRPAARMRLVIVAAGGLGVVSLLGAVMPTFWTFASTLVFFGLATSTMLTTANGFVQTTSDPSVRGRVLALYMAILMGGSPIGGPIVGAAADAFGARATFAISAVGGLLAFAIGAIWLVTERKLRFRWDRGVRVTHAGRPDLDDSREEQVETLTAPIAVLHRFDIDPPRHPTADSVPQEAPSVTGIIPIAQPKCDDGGEECGSCGDDEDERR